MPDHDQPHLDETDVEQFLGGSLSEEGRRRMVSHLLAGCGKCEQRVRETMRVAEAPSETARYEVAIVRAAARAGTLWASEQADREEGASLWASLRQEPPGRRLMLVVNSRRYRTAGVLDALLRDYHEVMWREPHEGLEMAELGLAIVERLDPGRYRARRLADLEAEALAVAANANRMASSYGRATMLAKQAAKKLSSGTGDILLEGRVLFSEGQLWQSLRRFEKAARVFSQAEQVYRSCGELHLAARALVARAEAIGHLHPARGVRLLRRAIPDIDGDRDPRLELAAHHSLAWYLNDAGQGWEAREQVSRISDLYGRFSGDAVASLSRAWLKGRIDRSLLELDEARRSYERAWAGYEELGMQIHLTMLSIDQAELKVAAGEIRDAAALLARILSLLRSWGVSPETPAVLRMLRDAVLSGRCERSSFRQASLVVRRSWGEAGAEEEAS